jgi:hypothetical protein
MRFAMAFDGTDVNVYAQAIRAGTIAVGGRSLKFAIAFPFGDCSTPDAVRIGFDVDGDGTVDLGSDGSYERYWLRDHAVVAFDQSYDFDVTDNGAHLVLRRAQAARTQRPSLQLILANRGRADNGW